MRRHNHVALIHALVDALARTGGMEKAKEEAKKVMEKRKGEEEDE